MYKQDPLDGVFGVRTTYISTPVQAGPKDDLIEIQGLEVVKPDKQGDFKVPVKDKQGKIVPPDTPQFDAIHTFAVVRLVVDMYQRALREIKADSNWKWEWQWGSNQPIIVRPRAGQGKNAFYDRQAKCLNFLYFPSEGREIYTCRSLDIVAHEAGHAILDAIKPGFWSADLVQTGALHESFGDITTILCLLSQLDVCEAFIAETKGDPYYSNFVDELAEEFGKALGYPRALRVAINDRKLSEEQEVHELSMVFTGSFYDILANVFDKKRNDALFNPAAVLHQTAEDVKRMLLYALAKAPEKNATFASVAEGMIEYASRLGGGFPEMVQSIFDARLITGPNRFKGARMMAPHEDWKRKADRKSPKKA